MVSSTQVMYTRALPNLSPLPIGTPATDQIDHPQLHHLLQRHLAYEAILYLDVRVGMEPRNAAL